MAIVLAACGGAATSGVSPSADPTPPAGDTPLPSAAPATSTPASTPPPAAWATETLTDVRMGDAFTLGDLAGNVVLLEGMATWCPPCLEQQQQAQLALTRLDPAKVRYISLDVDPREDAATLARYAERHGFAWTFAVAEPALLRELAEAYGDPVLTPPVTPVLVIGPDGSATLADLGLKDANQLIELAGAAGA
jgi:thiol-disulfide isomerase/thioredoxin